ncbi:hypothetical protein NADFUDRAFT_81021 [Nadsonia fulvescens var. elongata DSM 6958]|uniref:Uncharacterized protein n=1 Tax=Nadsonia fulvescens var. elongata DSM 6958 TaxID=857566 RepID=A0A1E3PRD2_9ASCO|nr:hypothetical protein NADFUDRAFT_81021 [Nadsonia fulvescens var. elongata DSM 6958]
MYRSSLPRVISQALLLARKNVGISGTRLFSTPSQTPGSTSSSSQSTIAPSADPSPRTPDGKPEPKELNKHAAFYRFYSRPLLKMFAISFLTLQALKLVWSSLEDEETKEKYAKANELRRQKLLDEREEWRNKKKFEKEQKTQEHASKEAEK